MRAVNLIPIDEPAAQEQEVMLIPVEEGAGNGSPSIVQRNAFIQSQADNPDQYIRQMSQHQVPTGYQTPDRAVVGMSTPQDQQAAETFKREYVEKPASGVLARAVRAIKLYAFPVAKAMDSISGNEDHQVRLTKEIEELSGFIDQQQPGPEVGEVGKFVRGIEELAPQIAAGTLGVTNLLSTATADKGIDAVNQGIDPATATILAEKQLAETAAFMRIPQTGKTLPQSLAIGAAGNPALGTLGRAADRIILDTTGYQQQAEAVKVFDPQAMAHEAAMGAMFSVDGHIRNSLAKGQQAAEPVKETAPPTEGRPVELVPIDPTDINPRQPEPTAPVAPELAASIKWAAGRLLDPAINSIERQNLKRMMDDMNPQKLELIRAYQRTQEQQKQTAPPDASREVNLVPLDDQPATSTQTQEPVFDSQPISTQGTALKTQPDEAPTLQNQQIHQPAPQQPGTVEQIPAGKRDDITLKDVEAPDAETARQAAAQHLNQVMPESVPAVGLSVGKAPRRDDNLKFPDNQPAENQARSADPEVEKRWQAAHGLNEGPGLIDRTKAFMHNLLSETQHFPNLDSSSFAGKRTADILRRFESSDVAAKGKTAEYLHSLTASFGHKKMDLFTRKVILDDLITEADKGRALPFGYTPETVKADHGRVSKLVEANPDIKAAVERRAEVNKALVQELVHNDLLPIESVLTPQGLEKFKATGKYDASDINTAYFRHQVLEHANARKWAGISTAGEVRNKQRGWQKGREGSEQDINTSFLEAEFEVYSQSMKELATKKALDEVLTLNDISPELREQAKKEKVSDWKTLIPEGHVVWQPEKGSVFYKGQTLPESIITRFAEDNPAFKEVMDQFRKVTILGGKKEEVVIPEGLAKTLDNLRTSREDATLDTINKKLVGGWKVWTLLSPRRALKYNLNNMSGDLDIALAADPGILKQFNTAWKNGLNRKAGRAMSKDEVDMLERGVIDAGISINEIPDISKLPGFHHLKEGERNVKLLDVLRTGDFTKLMPPNLIAKYFDTVSGLTQFREGLLREAAYLRAKELLEQGKTVYWASKPAEINSLFDIKDKAAKLSRELIGDYGNLSAHGEKIRTSLIPFWSFLEINSPRYYRLFKNAATRGEGGSTAARMAGVGTRKAAGAALGIAEKLFLTQLLFASVSAFNHLMYPDEERRLGDSKGGQMHIILGTTTDGKILTTRFQGAFADALSWFGLEDFPASWQKLQEGQMDSSDLMKKMALATPNKLANASAPFFKLGAELITGKQFWPDITRPTPIRDKTEHAARFLALDEEYKNLTGKPTKGYLDSLKRTMIYEHDPGEIAYQNTRQKVMEFLKKTGKEIPSGEPTQRSNALYYHKQALRYGDTEAADRYKQEYLQAGGKQDSVRKSIDRAHPLGLLPENIRYKFRQSLSPEEDQAFKEGLSWYRQVYKP